MIGNADALSRLPVDCEDIAVPVPTEWVHLVEFLADTPITAKVISDDEKISSCIKNLQVPVRGMAKFFGHIRLNSGFCNSGSRTMSTRRLHPMGKQNRNPSITSEESTG